MGQPPTTQELDAHTDPGGLHAADRALLRLRLEAEAEALMRRHRLLTPDDPIEASHGGRDEGELRAVALERDLVDALDARAAAALEAVLAALGRLHDGTFGCCEECGQPIEAARLRALPQAPRCLECQSAREHRR